MNSTFVLPSAPLLHGRQDFVLEVCHGKRVLHLGCVDSGLVEERFARGELMHQRLASVASELWGVDVDTVGIEFLRAQGFDHLLTADIGESEDVVALLRAQRFDVVLATEVLEHLLNPGRFLAAVQRLMVPHDSIFIVTVPNAFRLETLLGLWRGVELVHPDHNYWFSYHTAKTLLEKCGFQVEQVAAYAFSVTGVAPGGVSAVDRQPQPANPTPGTQVRPGLASRLVRYVRGFPGRLLRTVLFGRTSFWGDGLVLVATVAVEAER